MTREQRAWLLAGIILILFRPLFELGVLKHLEAVKRIDALNHIQYTKYLFFNDLTTPPHMVGYPGGFPAALYVFSLGNPANLELAFLVAVALSMILYRFSIWKIFENLLPDRRFFLTFLICELPYYISPFAAVLFDNFSYVYSLEMYSHYVGTIPSFVSFSLGVLGLTTPAAFPFLTVTAFGMSNSSELIITAFGLMGFAMTKKPTYLSPVVVGMLINPIRYLILIKQGSLTVLSGLINNNLSINRFTVLLGTFALVGAAFFLHRLPPRNKEVLSGRQLQEP